MSWDFAGPELGSLFCALAANMVSVEFLYSLFCTYNISNYKGFMPLPPFLHVKFFYM